MSKRNRNKKKKQETPKTESSELLRWLVGDSPIPSDELLLSVMEELDDREKDNKL
jgi:hypothetical protein